MTMMWEENVKEVLVDNKIELGEPYEKWIMQDAEETGQEDDSEKKVGKTGGSWIRRWRIPGLIIIILIAAGTAVFLKPDLLNIVEWKKKPAYSIDPANDNLKEEDLSPFFIPPSADLSKSAIRVDLTVIWDGVASVRYKTNELSIRSEVYDYLKDVAENTEDLSSQKAALEEGMSRIFRKSLRVKDLAIRIKELRFI